MSPADARHLADELLPPLMDGSWSDSQDSAYCALGEAIEQHLARPSEHSLPPSLVRWLNAELERRTERAA